MSEPTITAAAEGSSSVRMATSAPASTRAVDGSSDDAASGADFTAVLVAVLAGADPSAGAFATGRTAPDGEVGADGPSDVEVTATGVATASEVALLALGRWAAATTVPGSTTPTVTSTTAVEGADPAATTSAATTPAVGTAPVGVPATGLTGATPAEVAALRGAPAAADAGTLAGGTSPRAASEDGAITTAHLAGGVADVEAEAPISAGSTTTAAVTTTTTNVAASADRARDPGSVAGRAIERVLDALDVLENAPPPRRVTVDVGDTGGTRLQVALRGSEVHVSLVAGGGHSDLSGWARDLSTALEARGFSLGGDPGEGQRRDRPGADPDDPVVSQPDGRAEDASRSTADPSDPTTVSGHDGALRL